MLCFIQPTNPMFPFAYYCLCGFSKIKHVHVIYSKNYLCSNKRMQYSSSIYYWQSNILVIVDYTLSYNLYIASQQTGVTVLDSIQKRKRWEKQFDEKYIKPTFDNQVSYTQWYLAIHICTISWIQKLKCAIDVKSLFSSWATCSFAEYNSTFIHV